MSSSKELKIKKRPKDDVSDDEMPSEDLKHDAEEKVVPEVPQNGIKLNVRSRAHAEKIVPKEVNDTFSGSIPAEFRNIWSSRLKPLLNGAAQKALDKAAIEDDDPKDPNAVHIDTVNGYYKKYGDYPSTAITVYTLHSFVYREMNHWLRHDDATKNDGVRSVHSPIVRRTEFAEWLWTNCVPGHHVH